MACHTLVKGQVGLLPSCLSGFAECLQSCRRCRTCWHTAGPGCSLLDCWSALHVPHHVLLQEELQKVQDHLAVVQQAGEQQREVLKAEQDRHSQCTYFLSNAQTSTKWRAASCIVPCMHCRCFVVQAQVRQMVKSERELSSELRTAQDHIDAEMQQLKQSAQVSGSKR